MIVTTILIFASVSIPTKTDRYNDPLPPGAAARLGTVRFRPGGVLAAGLSADGGTLRTVSVGPILRTWDAACGRLLTVSRLPTAGDGDRLAASEDVSVVYTPGYGFLDVATGRVLSNPEMPQLSHFYTLKLSRNGRRAFTLLDHEVHDHRAMVWDTATGKSWRLIPGGTADTYAVLHPSGDRLTILHKDRTVCVEVESGRVVWEVDRPARGDHIFSSDAATFVVRQSGEGGTETWEVWDASTGARRGTLARPDIPHAGIQALSPDGRLAAVTVRGEYLIWDTAARRVVVRHKSHWSRPQFSTDGRAVIFAEELLQRYDLPGAKPTYPDTRSLGHSGRVTDLAYSQDGRRLASVGLDGTLRVWDMATALTVGELQLEPWYEGSPVSFSPDGTKVLCVARESHVCDATTLKTVYRLQTTPPEGGWARVCMAAWGESGTIVGLTLVHGKSGTNGRFEFVRWDAANGQIKETRPGGTESFGFVKWGAGVFPTAPTASWTAWGLHDVVKGKVAVNFGFGNSFLTFSAVAISSDGKRVAGYCRPQPFGLNPEVKPFVTVWETASGQQVATLPVEDGFRLVLTGDGSRLVAAGPTELTVWDVSTAARLRTYRLPDPPGRRWQSSRRDESGVESLAVSRDGKTVATGHADGSILVWDVTHEEKSPNQQAKPSRNRGPQ